MLLLFCISWFSLNLLQAIYSTLAHDEAYYWVWAQNLDWGFYEHPPMVAMFIKIGSTLLGGEVGVRLLTVITSSLIIYWTYVHLVRRGVWLYIVLVISVLMAHAGGVLTAPDTPLAFFTCLFYIFFKKYLDSDRWKVWLPLTLIVAAMMYSKYHGILIIGFCFLLNFKLLKRPSFWVITMGSLLIYSPHLFWLFSFGKGGLTYALNDRFQEHLELRHFTEYLLGQILSFGPFIGIILLFAALFGKVQDAFEKTLRRLVILVLAFFLIWCFRGHINANWTAPLFIPILILSHRYILKRQKLKKVVFGLAIPSVLIILLVRAHLVFDFIPLSRHDNRDNEFVDWTEYAGEVDALAKDAPVLVGSYQTASKLWFYRQKQTLPINDGDRKQQFYVWDHLYKPLADQRVLIIDKEIPSPDGQIDEVGDTMNYVFVNGFTSYRTVEMELVDSAPVVASPGSKVDLTVLVRAPKNGCIQPEGTVSHPGGVFYTVYGDGIRVGGSLCHIFHDEVCDSTTIPVQIQAPDRPGIYSFSLRMSTHQALLWWSPLQYDLVVE